MEVGLFWPVAMRETLQIIQKRKKKKKSIVLLSVYVLSLNSSFFLRIREETKKKKKSRTGTISLISFQRVRTTTKARPPFWSSSFN